MVRLILVIILTLWFSHRGAESATWYVQKDGSGDFFVVQDALDVAASGDTVRIGPGRFSEFNSYSYPGSTWHVYANVFVAELMIIGSGEGVTTIGPDESDTWAPEDQAVGVMAGSSIPNGLLTVKSLSITDLIQGMYIGSGVLEAENIEFLRNRYGIDLYVAGQVTNCQFEEISRDGISSFSPATNVTVVGCSFSDSYSAFYFQLTPFVSVEDCVIDNCRSVGQFDRCSGRMLNCIASNVLNAGLSIYGPGSFEFAGNEIQGGGSNLYIGLGADNLICENSIFSESRFDAIHITNCSPILRNNHILKGDGYSVKLEGFPQPPEVFVDMSNNYWGTTEADSLAAWIYDGNDYEWDVHGYVNYEPFSDVPLPTEQKSFGSVKAIYR